MVDYRIFDRDKFTIVGSPTITNDGIASGFTYNDYLTQNINIPSTTTELVVKTKFKYKKQSTNSTIWAFDNSEVTRLVVYSDSRILVWLRNAKYLFLNTNPLNDNDEVYIEVKIANNHYYVSGTINNIPFSEDDVFTNGLQDMTSFRIGSKFGNETNASLIDLKQFLIGVDGEEAFSGSRLGTLTDKLIYLNDTKQIIKQAIVDKGVEITPNTPFREYADKIGELPHIVVMTQQEYDDLEVKDPNTLYPIVEE